MIYSLIGQPESGKTTLATKLQLELRKIYGPNMYVFCIDGDDLRKIIPNKNYTYAGRYDNINRANTIATYLNHFGFEVVISLVNPFDQLRRELKSLNPKDVKEIYLHSERTSRLDHHVKDFEIPKNPNLVLNTSNLTVKQCISKILDL